MAEHWKSTPRYWCKHCSTYVRDTKLERQNHEATARHQGAVKRSLRDLHRGKEAEERERERARREVDRLNGVVSGTPSSSSSTSAAARTAGAGAAGRSGGGSGPLPESERKRQAEQLALLGVSIPQEFRGDLAMAGDWTVTATTIVEEKPAGDDDRPEAKARGVHKRERTDEEQEEEKAVKSLFKKPRRWGRDPRGVQGDEDLDALLSGGLVVKKTEEEEESAGIVKKEDDAEAEGEGEGEEVPEKVAPELPDVKKEEERELKDVPLVKEDDSALREQDGSGGDVPVVAFKKRKPKNIRQK